MTFRSIATESVYSMDERSFQRLLRRTVAIPVALLVLLAVVLVVEIASLRSALHTVDHADDILEDSRSLARTMVEMESAIRGFYLTGERSYLDPYLADRPLVSKELDELRWLTNDDPEQHAQLEQLRLLDLRWMDFAERLLHDPLAGRQPAAYSEGR